MRVTVGPGTYVLATSGGVDSMVLLDLLVRQSNLVMTHDSNNKTKNKKPLYKIIVAHFDHGMRADSILDRKLVSDTAKKHGLSFVTEQGKLGKDASEAIAREARYKFLDHVKKVSGARAIITAHHQDDVLETAVLNMIRGSGRRGLTSLRSNRGITRPLLDYTKSELREYADTHSVKWREDSTNSDTKYARNFIRRNVLPKLSHSQRSQLVILLGELHIINDALDAHTVNLLHTQPAVNSIKRVWFVHLPHDIAREVIYTWLRQNNIGDIDRGLIERTVIVIKTSQPGKKLIINKSYEIQITKDFATISGRNSHFPKNKITVK